MEIFVRDRRGTIWCSEGWDSQSQPTWILTEQEDIPLDVMEVFDSEEPGALDLIMVDIQDPKLWG